MSSLVGTENSRMTKKHLKEAVDGTQTSSSHIAVVNVEYFNH